MLVGDDDDMYSSSSYRSGAGIAYHVTPLATSQGSTASCSVISILLGKMFMENTTPTSQRLEQCIQSGMQAYRELVGGSSYISAPDAFQRMRISDDSSNTQYVTGVTLSDDIMGVNAPLDTPTECFTEAFLDPAFGQCRTLREGLDRFFTKAASEMHDGETLAAALSMYNHTVVIAAAYIGASARYHVVESLPTNTQTGIGEGTAAVWITSDSELGIRSFIEAAYPPATRQEVHDGLRVMNDLGTNVSGVIYSITTLGRAPTHTPTARLLAVTDNRLVVVN